MNIQKVGGLAALMEALAYVIGFVVFSTLLSPENAAQMTSQDRLAFSIDHKAIIEICNIIIYVVFGMFLVVLVIALHERLKNCSSAFLSIATIFGFIWAGFVIASGLLANLGLAKAASMYAAQPDQAVLVWQILGVVQEALGGGVEIVGGIWVLLVSWVALKNNVFPKPLNYLGLMIGVIGIVTLVPGLGELGAIFGLGQIPWFLWLGIYMLRYDS